MIPEDVSIRVWSPHSFIEQDVQFFTRVTLSRICLSFYQVRFATRKKRCSEQQKSDLSIDDNG